MFICFGSENKLSISKTLFWDEIDRYCMARTVIDFQFRYCHSYNRAKIELIYQTRFYRSGFSNLLCPIIPHQRGHFFEENSLYISQQFYFEKQIDWPTYRSTSMTDKCNVIDCAVQIEIQSVTHNSGAIFAWLTISTRIKKNKETGSICNCL